MPSSSIISEIRDQDYSAVASRISEFVAGHVSKTRVDGLVMGLSGGIDSAVTAYICANAGLAKKTLALIMPDTVVTPESEIADAQRVVSILGLEHKLIDIAPIIREYSMYLEPSAPAKANLSARIRSDILYYYANSKNRLVLGTSDRSEYLIGYYTKYGDGASDITPMISLYKTQIRDLARHLRVPERIIEKKSSPFLRKDDDAESEIGASYEQVDAALWCMIEKKMSIHDAARESGVEIDTVKRIAGMNRTSRHKRGMPAREELGQAYEVV